MSDHHRDRRDDEELSGSSDSEDYPVITMTRFICECGFSDGSGFVWAEHIERQHKRANVDGNRNANPERTLSNSPSPVLSAEEADENAEDQRVVKMEGNEATIEDGDRRQSLRKRNHFPVYSDNQRRMIGGNVKTDNRQKEELLDAAKSNSASSTRQPNPIETEGEMKPEANRRSSSRPRKVKQAYSPITTIPLSKANNGIKKSKKNAKSKSFAPKICFLRQRLKPHKCPHKSCHSTFSRRTYLNIHVRIHTGERPYECSFCPKRFNRQTELSNHERVHTGERPFVCQTCKKGFTQVTNLRHHEWIHKDIKRYACDECGKKFIQKGNMKAHKQRHH